jgi:hypothetical protein
VFWAASFGSQAEAKLIPYYRMDSQVFMASDVALCDEISYVKKSKLSPATKMNYDYQEATFKVVRALKGNFKPEEKLTIELSILYARATTDWEGQPRENWPKIPMGRALLFLKKDKDVWKPVTCGVKLIIDGEVHCYGQFAGNPGGLWLARMAPENIDVPAANPYDEKLLLKDLEIAQEKAKKLREPVRVDHFWREGVIRPIGPGSFKEKAK